MGNPLNLLGMVSPREEEEEKIHHSSHIRLISVTQYLFIFRDSSTNKPASDLLIFLEIHLFLNGI
jgi:hypothetical protein